MHPPWYSQRRGRCCKVPSLNNKASALVRTQKEHSFSVFGPKLFNMMPKNIRDFDGSLDSFKKKLDWNAVEVYYYLNMLQTIIIYLGLNTNLILTKMIQLGASLVRSLIIQMTWLGIVSWGEDLSAAIKAKSEFSDYLLPNRYHNLEKEEIHYCSGKLSILATLNDCNLEGKAEHYITRFTS